MDWHNNTSVYSFSRCFFSDAQVMGHSPSTVKQTYYTAPRHTADSSIHSGNPFTADNSDRVGTADGPFLCNCAGSPATGLSLKGNAEIFVSRSWLSSHRLCGESSTSKLAQPLPTGG